MKLVDFVSDDRGGGGSGDGGGGADATERRVAAAMFRRYTQSFGGVVAGTARHSLSYADDAMSDVCRASSPASNAPLQHSKYIRLECGTHPPT